MNDNELGTLLKSRGYEIGNAAIRADGKLLLNLNGVFMFRQDAVDLATGVATLDQVISRNQGKVFPDAP
jgi:hypothetical protein